MHRMLVALALMALSILPLNLTSAAQTTIHFTIDASENVHSISRLIYGVNQPIGGPLTNLTFTRFGGNRTTAYNWVTGASNAGNDYKFQNDDYMHGALAATLQNAGQQNAGALITVPINGYVSADESGPVDIHDAARFETRFKPEAPVKGSAFNLKSDPRSPVVYQDEFVNWVKTNYPYGQTDPNRPIYFELDNEPDIWASTHPEVHPDKVTYAELLRKSIAYSAAIKNVEPNALVYGPVNFGWSGIVNLQNAKDANDRDFESFYLKGLARASATAGKRLVDVLDIHWYSEATGGGLRITEAKTSPAVVAARLQAPRSLWDSTYVETSWITRDSTHGPIDLIPRLQKIIAENFPGTALSISEYNYGGGSEISGGIAEADVLGIFGKLNVFSANEWPLTSSEPYVAGALAMYRNFDGKKGSFGDTSISATTDDITRTSIYASLYSKNPNQMLLMAINKTAGPLMSIVELKKSARFNRADIFQLTSAKPQPISVGQIPVKEARQFAYQMPPYSVTMFRLLASQR